MKGFKDFVLRGNLVELAVAFIMAAAFAEVVTAMVDLIMGLVGQAGGVPDFSAYTPKGLPIGTFITAVISFLVLAAVVYFLIVLPYAKAREHLVRSDEEAAVVTEDVVLLSEIRDLLRARQG
ncbi:MAG: large conductance mechanosensitive channel protein MscL [Nocardioidaceae bacterium]|nr:large conductance mechanosensitive channel protein MscL [Nocardioidaceae bacterium]